MVVLYYMTGGKNNDEIRGVKTGVSRKGVKIGLKNRIPVDSNSNASRNDSKGVKGVKNNISGVSNRGVKSEMKSKKSSETDTDESEINSKGVKGVKNNISGGSNRGVKIGKKPLNQRYLPTNTVIDGERVSGSVGAMPIPRVKKTQDLDHIDIEKRQTTLKSESRVSPMDTKGHKLPSDFDSLQPLLERIVKENPSKTGLTDYQRKQIGRLIKWTWGDGSHYRAPLSVLYTVLLKIQKGEFNE